MENTQYHWNPPNPGNAFSLAHWRRFRPENDGAIRKMAALAASRVN
jgi:hypothetical protein